MADNTPEKATPEILSREDGAAIAYHRLPGKPPGENRGEAPGVVFLTGFMSDMNGSKALALEAHCRAGGRAFLRFDYTGHGESSGRFEDGTIGKWAEDAIYALDHLTEGPQVLVGSSMGGWIMLLAALARPERVSGLVGTAAAADFTENLIDRDMTPEQREAIRRDGFVKVACDYGDEPYTITAALIEDGRKHLLLDKPIGLACPVRLIQGMKDPDVPWETALKLSAMLESTDVEIQLVKEGDHRLSEEHDLDRLCGTVERLLDSLA